MPTGYTAGVQDGTVTDFSEFALQCARNFGALVTMRDDPWSTPIPERFEASEYARTAVVEAQQKLDEFHKLTVKGVEALQFAERETAIARRAEAERKRAEERERYETMLTQVQAWVPPTDDHEGLARFMREQLEESIRFDCGPIGSWYDPPPLLPVAEFREQRIAELHAEVERAERHLAEEVERAAGRTEWVRQLRDSLEGPGGSQ